MAGQALDRLMLAAMAAAFLGSPIAQARATDAPAQSNAQATVQGPEVRVAENIFVVPDRRAKSVTGWLIVKAGCADEANGDCRGLAHYLEHLLFLNRGSDHSSRISIFGGGSANGWTTLKSTAYFQRFPAKAETDAANLDKLIAHFAALLTEVKAEAAAAERERNVVLQEYNLKWGQSVYQRFGITRSLALLPGDPLGQRVGGSPETIKDFTVAAAQAFHKSWYAKSNSVLVLHGPIDPEAIKPIAAKHLAPLPDGRVPARSWSSLRHYPPASQVLNQTDRDAKVVSVYLDKIVHYEEPGAPADLRTFNSARNIVAAFLGSRLVGSPLDVLLENDGLITQGAMSVAKVRTGTMRLSFWAEPAPGVTPEKVVEVAQAFIKQLPSVPLTPETIDRLKTRLANGRDLLRQQPDKTADALVNWFAAHETYNHWTEREGAFAAVSAHQVKAVLDILAQPGREVVGILRPPSPVDTGSAAGSSTQ